MRKIDADQLMEFLHAAFPNLAIEQIQLYSRLLEREDDVELVSKALLRGIGEWKYPPSYADLKEFIRLEKKASMATESENTSSFPATQPKAMPMWVRRWVCARFLFARFQKDRDQRMFPEQFPYGAPANVELMPEYEWAEEAAQINLADAWKAIRSAIT